MKVLVIGAGSFSGRAFCRLLDAHGYGAIKLTRPRFDLNAPGAPKAIRHWVGDGYDTVVNFAALNMVGESWDNAGDYYQTNVVAMARLADAMKGAPLRRFVQVSTPEVYGATQTFLAEGAPFRPSTPYAISRAAADMHLRALHEQYGLPVCFTRTVNVYGPGQQLYRIIPKTIASIVSRRKLPLHGSGVSTRSFLHIDDVAAAILRVCEDGRSGNTYHVAHPVQTSIRGLVRMICDRMGADFDAVVENAPERPGKDMAYQLDDAKIRSEIGWSHTIPLEAGLAGTILHQLGLPAAAADDLEYCHKAVSCA